MEYMRWCMLNLGVTGYSRPKPVVVQICRNNMRRLKFLKLKLITGNIDSGILENLLTNSYLLGIYWEGETLYLFEWLFIIMQTHGYRS